MRGDKAYVGCLCYDGKKRLLKEDAGTPLSDTLILFKYIHN